MFTVDFFEQVKKALEHLYSEPITVALFTLFLIIATYTDLKATKIPDKLNAAFAIIRLLLIPIIGFTIYDFLGALIGFIGLFIPGMVLMKKMGGDIKCATVIGLYAGVYLTPIFLILSCVYLALTTACGYMFGKKLNMIPFAPFFLASNITLMIVYYGIL